MKIWKSIKYHWTPWILFVNAWNSICMYSNNYIGNILDYSSFYRGGCWGWSMKMFFRYSCHFRFLFDPKKLLSYHSIANFSHIPLLIREHAEWDPRTIERPENPQSPKAESGIQHAIPWIVNFLFLPLITDEFTDARMLSPPYKSKGRFIHPICTIWDILQN